MNKKITTIINFLLFMAFILLVNTVSAQSNDEKYRQTIESADKYFNASDYLNAKASYQVASQIKPSEQYPKDRLKESISRLRVQMEQMTAYNEKLDFADRLYDEESYDKAILAYEEARKLMPSDEYPSDQIELIKAKQLEEAQRLARYKKLIQDGDAFFTAASYTEARTKYEEASNIYPDNPEAQDKINAADDMLAEIAAQQSGYQKALSEAEMYHARKDYEKELESYKTASELKPEEAFPQIKIRELNEFIRKYEGYNKFVTEADELYISQQFAEAKVKYEQALEILPEESYPREIISKINIALSEKTERDKAAYEEAIAQADELYNQEDYDAAMVAYSDALRFWPDGAHAQERLSSISEIRALQRAQEEAYTNSISLADKLFADKDYKLAKTEYRKAADIKPFEQYPKVRLGEIDMILAELKNKLDQYESIILGADKLFYSGDYAEARIQYLKAQEIISDRGYPEDQIKMIDEILGLEKAVLDEYLAAIARGDEHFANREWEDAKVDYVTANDLIPEEQYPDDKITEINEILARLKAEMDTYTLALKNGDELFAERDYPGALAEYEKAAGIFTNEEYPRQKIEEISMLMAELEAERTLEENYANAIARADELFAEQDYTQAKAEYENAITIKAGDEYPNQKITEIDGILAEQARMRGLQESYAETMGLADEYMNKEQYIEAKAEYQRAAEILPEEVMPAQKIAEIDAIFEAKAERLAQIEADYGQAIADADAAFADADYTLATEKYNLALSLKAGESYPTEKLTEINSLLADQEAQRILEENYTNAITRADELFAEQDYTQAKAEYENAITIKAGDDYANQKITEIDDILAEQARMRGLQASYAETMALADEYMGKEQYIEAKAEYQRAAEILPEEVMPAQKIAEIDAILEAEADRLAQIEADYSKVITDADAAFAEADYELASEKYNLALSLKAGESYPTGKLTEINGLLADQEAQRILEEKYANAIARADELFAEQDYTQAKAEYENAITIKAGDEYPNQKINEIDGILAEQARMRGLQESYAETMALADEYMGKEQYNEAKAEYQRAAEILPEEVLPAQKIAEIDAIFEAEAERLAQIEADYSKAITDADAAFAEADYELASEKYNLALSLKAGESYPTGKLTEINGLLADQEAQRILEEKYANAIARADELFAEQDYTQAKAEYENAITIKAGDEYPNQKINEIDGILAEQARMRGLQESYAETMALADEYMGKEQYNEAKAEYQRAAEILPEEVLPAQKIAEIDAIVEAEAERLAKLEADYARAIAEADAAFTEADYELATEKYNLALSLKAGEPYPEEKLTEINGLLAEMEAQRILDENYASAINRADELLAEKDYTAAKTEYESALTLKSSEQYPQDKITEIEGIFAEQDRMRDLQESYAASIALADEYLGKEQYNEAIAEYQKAAEILPEEVLPAQKIADIEAILAEIAKEEERLAALQEQYRIALETADNFFSEKEYSRAREAYVRARDIKPEETFPVEKITEIDALLVQMEEQRLIEEGYSNSIALAENHLSNKEYAEARAEFEKALTYKASEQYPAEKIAEIDNILNEEARVRELAAAYEAAITAADASLANEEYEKARESYQNALTAKPEDTYASVKIAEIDATVAEITRLKTIEDNYNAAIASGDQAMDAKNFTVAREAYANALNIKAGEAYPAGKITEIDDILAENARTEALKREYDRKISSADSLLKLEEYESAKASYSDAVRLKSEEVYPLQKIDEINAIIEEIARQKALDEAYTIAVQDADEFITKNNYLEALQSYERALELKPGEAYPQSRIDEINSKLSELEEERNKAYNAAIAQADDYFSLGNYRSAKSTYQNAVDIKPDEQYARDRLDEASKLYMAEVEALKVDYRKYVAEADNYFNDKIYDGAIENYRLASALLPDEEYPGKMISRITKIINDNAITDVNQLAQIIPNNTERKFDFSSLPVGVRKQNYILIKARNLSDTEFKMLVSFGMNAAKTGGVVLQVPKSDGVKDYIVRIGAMYKWFSEDNNWLSIYPEGGDLEVALIRISKSD